MTQHLLATAPRSDLDLSKLPTTTTFTPATMPPKSKKTDAPIVSAVPTAPAKAAQGSVRWDRVVSDVVSHYVKATPQLTKLIDVFMVYLAVVGAVQFLYCILAGNYVRGITDRISLEG